MEPFWCTVRKLTITSLNCWFSFLSYSLSRLLFFPFLFSSFLFSFHSFILASIQSAHCMPSTALGTNTDYISAPMEPHCEYLWSPLCETFTYIWIYLNIMSYFWHVFLFPQANCFYSLLFRKIRVTLCMHAKSLQLCSTLQLYGLQPTRLHCPWDSPGKDPGVGCHALLQGNLPDPGIKPVSLVSRTLAWGFFTTSAPSVGAKSLQSSPTLCDTVDCS